LGAINKPQETGALVHVMTRPHDKTFIPLLLFLAESDHPEDVAVAFQESDGGKSNLHAMDKNENAADIPT
jgi:hypothetical protein